MKKITKYKLQLSYLNSLAYLLFLYDELRSGGNEIEAQKREEKWIDTKLDLLFQRTPKESVLGGQGTYLIKFLEAKLGIKETL